MTNELSNLTELERKVLRMIVNRTGYCVADTNTYEMFRSGGIGDNVEDMIAALEALNSLVTQEIVHIQTADWKELSNPHRSRPMYYVGTRSAIYYKNILG